MPLIVQVLAIAGSTLATIIVVTFRLGQFEARVMTRLDEHERRLGNLERFNGRLHGFVQQS